MKGRADKDDETKDEKMLRRKIEKGKRHMELQLDNANQLELAKYNNKDVRNTMLSDSEDTDEILDSKLMNKVDKIEKVNLKRQKLAEDEDFINPLTATKKDIKRMKNKGKMPEKVTKKAKPDNSDSDQDEFDSDADDLADQLDKGTLIPHLTLSTL